MTEPRPTYDDGRPLHFTVTPIDELSAMSNALTEALRENERLRKQVDELTDALRSMVGQHCHMPDGTLSSSALSANAEAMEVLADAGEIELSASFGRMVVGKWSKK